MTTDNAPGGDIGEEIIEEDELMLEYTDEERKIIENRKIQVKKS